MEGPVAPHSIYPRHGVRALILFSSFHLAGNLHFLPPRTPTVCLSRFLLKSRWWLYSPGLHPTPPRRSNLSHPPRPSFRILLPSPSRQPSSYASFLLLVLRSSSSPTNPQPPHLPLYRDNPLFTARLRFVGR